MTALVIMNGNLRLYDNPALDTAAKANMKIIPVFIYDEKFGRPLGSSHRFWLHHSLEALASSFKEKNTQLILRKGDFATTVTKLLKESGAETVFIGQPLDPKEEKVLRKLELEATAGNVLVDPEEIRPGQAPYYKVFSPFWKKCLQILEPPAPLSLPKWKTGPKLKSDSLSSWNLLKNHTCTNLSNHWKPGEKEGRRQLDAFLKTDLFHYPQGRDLMGLDKTSRLSPYLRFGEVSVREIWHKLAKKRSHAAEVFLSEIGWREFATYLLYHFPRLGKENFQVKFDKFPWKGTPSQLKRWQNGETGYPIVDAGMRQLKETGWMHNRVRMIVGSFLVKDLLIDWRKGEAWFWDLLVDGDPALNTFNWQWVAGSGADAAPYFRIFNPTTQGEKFDPEGEYVRRWVSELSHLEGKKIHAPWNLDEKLDYPDPIIDHKKARDLALSLFKKL